MEFNSQICTTRSQSERLLALGLKKETADCIWCEVRTLSKDNPIQWRLLPKYIDKYDEKHIPSWSLHRLIEMMPKRIKNVKEDWDMCGHDIAFVITEELDVNYEEPFEDEPCYNKYFYGGNLYDKIVDSIAWLIQKGYFNKEYLEGI